MAYKSCYSCGGTGSYWGTESQYDPSGGFMYKSVQVRKTCGMCSGTGQVYTPDPPSGTSGRVTVTPRAGRAPKIDTRTPEEKRRDVEDGTAGVLMLAAWIGIGWYGVTNWAITWYWPVGLGFLVGAGIYRLCTTRLRIIPKLILWTFCAAYIAIALAGLVVIGYVAIRLLMQ